MPITTFCADADVQKILSANGVSLRVDDDAGAALWAREEAAVETLNFVGLLYTTAALQASNWFTRVNAWLAASFLCRRRNNPVPTSISERIETLTNRLEEIRLGARQIADAAQSKTAAPVLSNQRLRLIPFPQAITETGRSTGKQEGYTPHNDRYDYYDYSI